MAAAQFCTRPRRRSKTRRGRHSKSAAFEGVVRLVDWAVIIGRSRERMMKGESDSSVIQGGIFMLASQPRARKFYL